MERTFETAGGPKPRAWVAPPWHTLALVGFFAALTVGGAVYQHAMRAEPAAAQGQPHVVPLYLSLLALEWGMLRFVTAQGLRRTGTGLAELVGARWRSVRDVARDGALAVLLWLTWTGVSSVLVRLLPTDGAASIQNLLPHGPLEKALWIALSISAGVCEEIVFRGYLQRQLAAWTGSWWLGWVGQALVFGLGHGYQGPRACALIALFGGLYGLLARWRGSLLPGIVGHALTDLLSGLFGI